MASSIGIVCVGRNNRDKQSFALARIAASLESRGFAVEWFATERTRASRRIDQRIAQHWPGIAASREPHHRWHRRMARFFIKGILVLCEKQRWAFMWASFQPKHVAAANELGRFVEGCGFDRVHLITHSAGGIAATRIPENPKVASICCIGYPFKHPQRPPENYRTEHLAQTIKPLLIVQGTLDEYGLAPAGLAAILPPHARIVTIECDHEFADISRAQLEQVLLALDDLMAEAPARPA